MNEKERVIIENQMAIMSALLLLLPKMSNERAAIKERLMISKTVLICTP